MVTERQIQGETRYFLERMENGSQQKNTADTNENSQNPEPYYFYVDCGLSYHAKEHEGKKIRYVGGLEHLQGQEIAILADGAVCPAQTVRELFFTENGEQKRIVGIDIGYEAKNIAAGLGYTAKLKSMPLEAENAYGNTQGKYKHIQGIGVYFKDTNYAKIGSRFQNMDEVKMRRNEKPGQAVNLHTAYTFMRITQSYEKQNYACIMSDMPLPITVLALLPEVGLGA